MENFDFKKIKAIIGLGNPGQKYYKNRHNIGFRVLDELVSQFGGTWSESKELNHAQVFMKDDPDSLNTHKVFLVKPQTFMNSSGRACSFLLKKGIKPEEILVVHDELEKKFGKLAIRLSGSARGHNGLRSIIGVVGKDFWRLRFGVGRPENKSDVANFVLSNFSSEEEIEVPEMIQKSVDLILQP